MSACDGWLRPFEPSASRPWDTGAAVHLLRRAALGHPPALVERCLAAGPAEAAALLVGGQPPDERERWLIEQREVVLASEEWRGLASWWWARLLMTAHPLQARIGLFWHDHFATSVRKVKSAYWMAQQLDAFDAHGLGDFRELVLAVAKSPAMLRWLDNEQNRKGKANENFARELFELFTLGRDHYTEDDIKEAARAFTGWRIRRERFYFDRRRHDRGEKTVFGESGRFGGEEIIDLALARDDCPRFLAHKLLATFVGPRYPEGARDELAKLLRDEALHVGRALRALLASRVFHAPEARGARIRGPVEWIVWLLRTLECTAAPVDLSRASERMGQNLLDPPDVSGWDQEEAWISSATWLHRTNFAGRIGGGQPYELRPRLDGLVGRGGTEREVAWLIGRLFPDGIDGGERRALERQARGEASLPRAVRLQGLLRACLMLPRAHRF